ncbi:MAG TPA: hypothetical protein VMB71_05440 [Acetobacteraceae bacterium]|nr:hypothetical protein [Acetobacteraceae bacterium]
MVGNSGRARKHIQAGCCALALLAAGGLVRAASEGAVYSFKGGSDGAYPDAAPIKIGATLYGTTAGGGAAGNGTA